jgi:ATP-dependent Clp protease adaptor protein ClpS
MLSKMLLIKKSTVTSQDALHDSSLSLPGQGSAGCSDLLECAERVPVARRFDLAAARTGNASVGLDEAIGSGDIIGFRDTMGFRDIIWLSSPPGGGDAPPPNDPSKERDRGVSTKERSKSARPPRFKVILYNDNYTPMEFVVEVLEKLFGKSPSAATQIMLQIHKSGMGIAGVFVLEVAETKSAAVHRLAEERGYPLRTGVEKE